jgi:hypothetical protein
MLKMNRNNKYIMNRSGMLFFPVLLMLLLTVVSCNKVKKPEVFIEQDIMTTILTDLYIADGLLNNPVIRNDFANIDSTENYMRVIEKHGFTMGEFETNIEYYFNSEPKKYQEIYDVVLATLSEMEAQNVQARRENNPSTANLWNGEGSYRMPDDGTSNPVEFEIPVIGQGVYVIRARLTLFEDDQSIDPRPTIYFWYDNGTDEGYRDMWESNVYEKSPRSQQLEFKKELKDTLVTHIKGKFIDFSPQPGHWEMHSSISGFNVSYIPAGNKDDSPADI